MQVTTLVKHHLCWMCLCFVLCINTILFFSAQSKEGLKIFFKKAPTSTLISSKLSPLFLYTTNLPFLYDLYQLPIPATQEVSESSYALPLSVSPSLTRFCQSYVLNTSQTCFSSGNSGSHDSPQLCRLISIPPAFPRIHSFPSWLLEQST